MDELDDDTYAEDGTTPAYCKGDVYAVDGRAEWRCPLAGTPKCTQECSLGREIDMEAMQ